MSWFDILKQKPDYPDLDGDGDKEEPMVDALKIIEQVESAKKSPDMKHYKKNGELWTGKTHKTKGQLMTGETHTEVSEDLFHEGEA